MQTKVALHENFTKTRAYQALTLDDKVISLAINFNRTYYSIKKR